MTRIAMSSAHSQFVRGAKGVLDETDESRRLVDRVAALIRGAGGTCHTFHDNVSRTQSANIGAIVKWHRAQTRDRDVSCHFNAYKPTAAPRGVEVLHRSQAAWAAQISAAIAAAGKLINRGAKQRTNLGFLNQLTTKPAVLLEVAFVDSQADAKLYRENFEAIARAIAETVASVRLGAAAPAPSAPAPQPAPQAQQPAAPPAAAAPAPVNRPTLRRGSTGDQVRVVQSALGAQPDGVFGPVTETRVRNFQRSQSLVADGIVGARSWAALERVYNLPPLRG